MQLTEDNLAIIHDRLVDQADATAFLAAFDTLQEMLLDHLHRVFPQQRTEDCEDIVAEMLTNYFNNPAQFDPAKSRLDAYLRMAVSGDMKNLLEKEKRIKEKVPFNLDQLEENGVADQALTRNNDQDRFVEDQALANALTQPRFEALLDKLNASDQAVVQLMIESERQTARYAEVLGIAQQPIEEQRQIVKRAKDRLTKWLKRQLMLDGF